MSLPLRAALFILLVPGSVAGWIPWALATAGDPSSTAHPALRIPGALCLALGWATVLWCTRDFVRRGRGTPSPHDPPRALVSDGVYGVVRNPMYVAVLLAVLGIALWHRSALVLGYAAIVALTFHVRVVRYEEPRLARTFGTAYDAYRATVPRWLPGRRRSRSG